MSGWKLEPPGGRNNHTLPILHYTTELEARLALPSYPAGSAIYPDDDADDTPIVPRHNGEGASAPSTLVAEREHTHGDWAVTAGLSQDLCESLRAHYRGIPVTQRAALEMICVKIARIVCGNPNHADHWRDIAGYAELGGRDAT